MDLQADSFRLLRALNQTVGSSLDIDEVLQRIIEVVRDITRADGCFLYLLDRPRKQLVLKASWNKRAGSPQRVAVKFEETAVQENRIAAVAREAYKDARFTAFLNLPGDRCEAFLSVPLVAKDKVIGVVNVQHLEEHEYTEAEITLVGTAAQFAGVTVANARLYKEAKKKASQLEVLSKISQTMIFDQYFEETLIFIASAAVEIAKTQVCSIMLADEEKQTFNFRVIFCPDRVCHGEINLPINQTICERTYASQKPFYVRDVTDEAKFALPDFARQYRLRSMLSVPIILRRRVLGVINVYSGKPRVFSEEEIGLLQVVANQAAVAVHNEQLAREVLRSKNDLAAYKKLQRAKGILMKDYKITEEEAHRLLLRKSMSMGKPLPEIVEAVITGSAIRPESG